MRLTINRIKQDISATGRPLAHDPSTLAKACRHSAKRHGMRPYEVFRLLCFNEPSSGTHSYGFHTGFGRAVIEDASNMYYHLKLNR